ncbi:MAG: HlyC/CorC family transporter [Nitrospirae bacterium]|nr:HlyC/CorC family transporter [Nitrospirota bacterium]
MGFDIFLVFLFILFSGFFACSEIAVIASRKTMVETLVKEGSKRAGILMSLKTQPDRFLATVQIGVTIGTALSSAIAGAIAVTRIKPIIAGLPVGIISVSAEPIALGLVVGLVSYATLVIGELVPKTLALMNPEKVALIVARPIYAFSRISALFVNLLTGSTNLLLRPFGKKAFTQRGFISEEEIKMLIQEGKDRGIFETTEQELIHSVFEFTDISVKEVMVPIGQVVCITLDGNIDKTLRIISEEQYSRYPVYNKNINNIKGVLYSKDLFSLMAQNKEVNVRKLLRAPFFVPETMMISSLLGEMQKKRTHMAIVVDEYGMVSGIATIEDLIEEIVGEIRDEHDTERPVIEIGKDTYIVYASISIRDLKEDYAIDLPESPHYDTLGGFIVTTLQKIPERGETISLDHMKMTVVEMVNTRVSKVKIEVHGKECYKNEKLEEESIG